MLDKAIAAYKDHYCVDFPNEYKDDWEALRNLLIVADNKLEETKGHLTLYVEAWHDEGLLLAYYSERAKHLIVVESDFSIAWNNYDELRDELWSQQEYAQSLEKRLSGRV